jgi:hypothetical protein
MGMRMIIMETKKALINAIGIILLMNYHSPRNLVDHQVLRVHLLHRQHTGAGMGVPTSVQLLR